MNRSISSIELLVQTASHSGKTANHQSDQQDNSAFAKLMAVNESSARMRTGVAAADSGGNRLPSQRTKPATGKDPADADSGAGMQSGAPDAADRTAPDAHADSRATQEVDANTGIPQQDNAGPATTDATSLAATATAPVTPTGVATTATVQTGTVTEQDPASRTAQPDATQLAANAAAQQTGVAEVQQAPALSAATASLAETVAHGQHKAPVEQPAAGATDNPVVQSVHNAMMKLLLTQDQNQGGQQPGTGDRLPSAASLTDGGTLQGPAADSLFARTLSGAGAATALPSGQVAVTMGHPGWGRAVGEQVMWFVSQNIRSASLRLNPQHLGPMELQVQMDGDKASIAFSSQHAMVRDALESSLPRLREMFSANGLDLVNVNVSQQQDSGTNGGTFSSPHSNGGASQALSESVDGILPGAMLPETAVAQGLVDYYV
jgi:flagellar hook-length control protein FliK